MGSSNDSERAGSRAERKAENTYAGGSRGGCDSRTHSLSRRRAPPPDRPRRCRWCEASRRAPVDFFSSSPLLLISSHAVDGSDWGRGLLPRLLVVTSVPYPVQGGLRAQWALPADGTPDWPLAASRAHANHQGLEATRAPGYHNFKRRSNPAAPTRDRPARHDSKRRPYVGMWTGTRIDLRRSLARPFQQDMYVPSI